MLNSEINRRYYQVSNLFPIREFFRHSKFIPVKNYVVYFQKRDYISKTTLITHFWNVKMFIIG